MIIVLLPGLDGTGILFKPFLEALPEDIKTLVVSYPLETKLNYQELVDFVFKQLPKEDFIIVAESFSGYIAYLLTIRSPKYLQSVIFASSFLESPHPQLLKLSKFIPSHALSLPLPSVIIKAFLFGLSTKSEVIKLFKQSLKKTSSKVLSHRLQLISELPQLLATVRAKGSLPQPSTTISYIQATNDNLIPKESFNDFKKVYRDIELFKVEGSHFILQTNPSACAQVILDKITQKKKDKFSEKGQILSK